MLCNKISLQKIYADQVGARLEGFRVQAYSPYRSNFRCPICGDSAKNKFKKRAYFLEESGFLIFYCHNSCGTIGFEKFLKEHYDDLYTLYKFDIIKQLKEDNPRYQAEEIIEDKKEIVEIGYDLNDLLLAEDDSVALEYIKSRKIPENFWSDIYYTEQFPKYINTKIPNKFDRSLENLEDKRIVLPLRDKERKIFGVIARSLNKNNSSKYLTIKFDESHPKIFGIDRLNRSLFSYVAEGPIDSFFIDNCVALAGTDGRPDDIFFTKSDYAIVLDNQPRAIDVLKKYEKYIQNGCKVVIWPEYIKEKDPNEMIKNGLNKDKLNEIIRLNTYSGLKLKIMFNAWRKI